MRAPSPAIAGSIALHAGIVALALVSWPRAETEIKPTISSVPVSIVSSMEIAAALADNPAEELIEDTAATAPIPSPVEAPPEPAPTPPTPTPPTPTPPTSTPPTPRPPTPRPPTKAPTPAPRPAPTPAPKRAEPTPPRATPTPARPAPARPAPARPAPKSNAAPLDLDSLAGPPRPAPNRGTRPATGQQGTGRAPQATGAQVTAIFNQVYPNWTLPCDIPGADQLRIQMDVTLSADGRITGGPTLRSPQSDPVYRAAADGAVRALRQTAPFDVPDDFPGGAYRPTFNTERACRNR